MMNGTNMNEATINETIMSMLITMARDLDELDRMKYKDTSRPDYETLSKLFECYTTREVAAMYHVSNRTVESWVHQYETLEL